MVCVPCFAVPIFLIIWRFLIQPLLMKWWQLRNRGKEPKEDQQCPNLVKECKNDTCTLSWSDKTDTTKKTD